MSMNELPKTIDPFKLANERAILTGFLLLKELPRLEGFLVESEGHVAFNMNFGKDDQDLCYIKGHVSTQVLLQCQRCLESFTYDINASFQLSPVKTDVEAKALPWDYDPLMVGSEPTQIKTILEDEIILNLPIIAKHEMGQCKIQLPFSVIEKAKNQVNAPHLKNEGNPFSVLESLRKRGSDPRSNRKARSKKK